MNRVLMSKYGPALAGAIIRVVAACLLSWETRGTWVYASHASRVT